MFTSYSMSPGNNGGFELVPQTEPKLNNTVVSDIRPKLTDIVQALPEEMKAMPDIMPEVNYWSFSLCQSVLSEIFHVMKPLPGQAGLAWNMMDAVWQLICGLAQWFNNETHRPNVEKTKAVLNILSALQMGILSCISFAMFGGPTFAAAFGVGFMLSLMDTWYSMKRYFDGEYYKKDNTSKYNKNDLVITKLTEELAEDQKLWDAQNQNVNASHSQKTAHQLLGKVIASKQARLAKLNAEQVELNKPHMTMKESLKKDILNNLAMNIVWGFAFSGMLLLCIPGLQPIGSILVITAAALYFSKHSYALGKKIGEKANSFFKPAPSRYQKISDEDVDMTKDLDSVTI